MSTILHVLEHPDPGTLARRVFYDTSVEPALAQGWKRRTVQQQEEWEAAQIASGWQPVVAPSADAVPNSVSTRQLSEELIVRGLIDQIEAIVAAAPGTEGRIIRNWWQRATYFERNHPLVAQMAALLTPPLTSADLDAIWRSAAQR